MYTVAILNFVSGYSDVSGTRTTVKKWIIA